MILPHADSYTECLFIYVVWWHMREGSGIVNAQHQQTLDGQHKSPFVLHRGLSASDKQKMVPGEHYHCNVELFIQVECPAWKPLAVEAVVAM